MKPTRLDAIIDLVGGEISSPGDDSIIYLDGQTAPTEEAIQAKLTVLQADYDSKQYQRGRKAEYPECDFQLDYIFHHGLAKWKTDIVQPVKDKYPKP